jgi:tetratricopeptide (TPR) repeat protein
LSLLVLQVLVCASCLAGERGRLVYADQPSQPAQPSGPPLAMPKSGGASASAPVSPLLLTSADGTVLTLDRLRVRGVVDGPLALTEFHMDFVNAEDRTIEGRFEFTLPPGAEISRFAMRVGDSWQEAEVVEKQKARVVYEAILHQGLDPALLETEAGNRFNARVFPIAPRETKQLIVAYTQALDASPDAYSIPLWGLPKLAELDVEVSTPGTNARFTRVFERYLAQQDLVVPLPGTQALAWADRDLAVARIVPVAAEETRPEGAQSLDSLTILFDTSASRAADFAGKLDRFERFCAALRVQLPDAKLTLIAFDQVSETIYEGPIAGLGEQHFDRIAERRALGATALGQAIAGLRAGASKRLLLVSDGIATAGEELDVDALVRLLADRGFERVDALIDGSVRDQAILAGLVGGELSFAGQIIELGKLTPADAALRVRRPTLAPVTVAVEGASWVWPSEITGLQPGDDVLVWARFDKPRRSLDVATTEQGQKPRELDLELASISRPLLERGIVSRQVGELITELEARAAQEPDWAASARRTIISLSTEHRVLTPYTAMLVLEDSATYARFGLQRDELAPILAVDERGGVALTRGRDELPRLDRAAEANAERWEAQASWQDASNDGNDEPQPERHEPRMQQLESKAKQLAELEHKQEEQERRRLLELERQAAAAGTPSEEELRDRQEDLQTTYDDESPLEFDEPDIDGLLDPSRVSPRISASESSDSYDMDNPLESSPADAADYDARDYDARQAKVKRTPRPRRPPRTPPIKYTEVKLLHASESIDLIAPAVDLAQIDATLSRCYDESLRGDGAWSGRAEVLVDIDGSRVAALRIDGADGHPQFDRCLRSEAPSWLFRRSPSGDGQRGWLLRRYAFKGGEPRQSNWSSSFSRAGVRSPQPIAEAPVEGHYAEVLELLANDERERALELAVVWHELFPGDPLALLALGKALVAAGRIDDAARAYGGIIDLHPSRADIRRFAGNLLESLPEPELTLAIDTYARAVAARPDQPSSYRMLAMAQARSGALEDAFTTLEQALELRLPDGRYQGVGQILRADLELIAAAWAAREPKQRTDVLRRTMTAGVNPDEQPSVRFVLTWETDASDVDLHVRDALGQHAYYQYPSLASGGRLIADVTTGLGPEGFIITEPRGFPYLLSVDYYDRRAAGHGMGQVQILAHDGAGGLTFENRPFVVMTVHREFELGEVEGPSD